MRIYYIFLFFIAFVASCSSGKKKQDITVPENIEQHLVNANKIVIANESETIENYIKAHKWEMKKTGTGLRYMIYKNGEGPTGKTGNRIKFDFSVELLDSTVCYSAKDVDPIELTINQSDQIRGLNELATYLKKGDKVKAILPPHLAYGIAGDNDQIPPRATLIFDIEVLELK